MENQRLYPTEFGTGQGSIISPTLALMTLSGLEHKLKKGTRVRKDKVHFISYADDFVITGESKEVLEGKVIPIVTDFLKEVGLELSQEKSKITHIDEGFDFLGFNIRKYSNGKLLIKPAKENIKDFLQKTRHIIKAHRGVKTEELINMLNPKITGWSNYYRHFVSSKTFSYIDHEIFKALNRWAIRRHPRKSKLWIRRKYYKQRCLSNWNFHAMIKDKDDNHVPLYLKKATETSIRRHIKIRGRATPYNLEFKDYFKNRESTNNTRKAKGSGFKLKEELPGDYVTLLRA